MTEQAATWDGLKALLSELNISAGLTQQQAQAVLQVLQKSSAQSPQMAGPSQPPSFMSTSPFALDNINPPTNIDVLSEVAQLLSAQSQPFAQEHSSPAYPVGQTSSFLPVDQMGMAPATSSDIPAQSYDRRLASDAQTSWPSSQGTSSQSSGAAKMHPVGSGVMSPKDSQDSGSLQPPSKEADVGVSEGSDIYASDSEDGSTAQVAVHNVPFKWCNADLEKLFVGQNGFSDAQLLFHDNGRSKGVGVVLFSSRHDAKDAIANLTGTQADGRRLDLVLMSEANHISFDSKMVAILGLPWEYTSADARALLDAAAVEEDGAAEGGVSGGEGSCVEKVEVAYREDGKSEGRAVAWFKSREAARAAIARLHHRETLAGLRLRLFFLQPPLLHAAAVAASPAAVAQLQLRPQLQSLGMDILGLRYAGTGAAGEMSYQPQDLGPLMSGSMGGFTADNQDPSPIKDAASAGAAGGAAALPQASAAAAGGDPGADPKGRDSGGGSSRSSGSSTLRTKEDAGPVILHVSGLHEGVTREQLRELFSAAGEVTKVDIPDGGRSMGYGFITFSNSEAAEQAMLQFNNYPLAGGAIHVAYSTSATARARQQALRQAKRAALTLPQSPASPAVSSSASSMSAAQMGGLGGGLAALGLDYNNMNRQMSGPAALGGTIEGVLGRGMSGYAPQQQQASMGRAGSLSTNVAGFMGGPAGSSIRRTSLDDAAAWQAAAAAAAAAGGGGGGQRMGGAGTGAGAAVVDANVFGGFAPYGAVTVGGGGGGGGLGVGFGASPSGAVAADVTGAGLAPRSPSQQPPGGYTGAGGIPGGMEAGFDASGLQHASRQVYVSGLPLDLQESQLMQLFSVVGVVEHARKPRNKDYGFVRFHTVEAAALAVKALNGAPLPGGSRLSVQFSTSVLDRHAMAGPGHQAYVGRSPSLPMSPGAGAGGYAGGMFLGDQAGIGGHTLGLQQAASTGSMPAGQGFGQDMAGGFTGAPGLTSAGSYGGFAGFTAGQRPGGLVATGGGMQKGSMQQGPYGNLLYGGGNEALLQGGSTERMQGIESGMRGTAAGFGSQQQQFMQGLTPQQQMQGIGQQQPQLAYQQLINSGQSRGKDGSGVMFKVGDVPYTSPSGPLSPSFMLPPGGFAANIQTGPSLANWARLQQQQQQQQQQQAQAGSMFGGPQSPMQQQTDRDTMLALQGQGLMNIAGGIGVPGMQQSEGNIGIGSPVSIASSRAAYGGELKQGMLPPGAASPSAAQQSAPGAALPGGSMYGSPSHTSLNEMSGQLPDCLLPEL
eukprot:jgi/Chrzof1/12861/Cz07g10020.t1